MASGNYPTLFSFIELPQFDGQPIHRTLGDPGGATSWGWTWDTWFAYATLHGIDTTLTEFEGMIKQDFYTPTQITFWNGVQGDRLPPGVDVIWTDFNFTSHGASKTLQTLLGVKPDGMVGDLTIAAAREQTFHSGFAGDFLTKMTNARIAYYKSLNLPQFLNGWTNRANACLKMALPLLV